MFYFLDMNVLRSAMVSVCLLYLWKNDKDRVYVCVCLLFVEK